jgi:hypothetical protein
MVLNYSKNFNLLLYFMITCAICKEMFAPASDELQKEVCPKCVETNKKSQLSRLAPRLGQRHALPFDRGVARTVSYGDKFEKSKTKQEDSKPNNTEEKEDPAK